MLSSIWTRRVPAQRFESHRTTTTQMKRLIRRWKRWRRSLKANDVILLDPSVAALPQDRLQHLPHRLRHFPLPRGGRMYPVRLVQAGNAAHILKQKRDQCRVIGPGKIRIESLELLAVCSAIIRRDSHPQEYQFGWGP